MRAGPLARKNLKSSVPLLAWCHLSVSDCANGDTVEGLDGTPRNYLSRALGVIGAVGALALPSGRWRALQRADGDDAAARDTFAVRVPYRHPAYSRSAQL
jgi:hypothetical protein